MNCGKNCQAANVTKGQVVVQYGLIHVGGTIWKSSKLSPVEKRHKELDYTEMRKVSSTS